MKFLDLKFAFSLESTVSQTVVIIAAPLEIESDWFPDIGNHVKLSCLHFCLELNAEGAAPAR